jgi:hypothetical protein
MDLSNILYEPYVIAIISALILTFIFYLFIKETNNYHPINKIESLEFRELNKRELYYMLHHLNDFKRFLEKNPNFVLNEQYIINKKLLDFNNIPLNIFESISKLFKNNFKKKSSSYKNSNNYLNEKTNSNFCHNKSLQNDKLLKKDEIASLKLTIKKTNNMFSALCIYDLDDS